MDGLSTLQSEWTRSAESNTPPKTPDVRSEAEAFGFAMRKRTPPALSPDGRRRRRARRQDLNVSFQSAPKFDTDSETSAKFPQAKKIPQDRQDPLDTSFRSAPRWDTQTEGTQSSDVPSLPRRMARSEPASAPAERAASSEDVGLLPVQAPQVNWRQMEAPFAQIPAIPRDDVFSRARSGSSITVSEDPSTTDPSSEFSDNTESSRRYRYPRRFDVEKYWRDAFGWNDITTRRRWVEGRLYGKTRRRGRLFVPIRG